MSDSQPLIHVVDDDGMFRTALARVLALAGHVVKTYASAGDFLLARDGANDGGCVILDINLPGPSGLDLHEALARSSDALPVIFVTGYGDVPSTVRAMKAGAVDFLSKPVDRRALLAAVEQALARDRERRSAGEQKREAARRFAALTSREVEVLRDVVAGRLNKQIATRLEIAERTVKTYRARVMEKLGVASVAELVRVAADLPSGDRDNDARAANGSLRATPPGTPVGVQADTHSTRDRQTARDPDSQVAVAVARARGNVAVGERLVDEQLRRIAQMRAAGRDVSEAEALLDTFDRSLLAMRDHLAVEEAEARRAGSERDD